MLHYLIFRNHWVILIRRLPSSSPGARGMQPNDVPLTCMWRRRLPRTSWPDSTLPHRTQVIRHCHKWWLPKLYQIPMGDQVIQWGQVALGGERKPLYLLGLSPLAIKLIPPNRGYEDNIGGGKAVPGVNSPANLPGTAIDLKHTMNVQAEKLATCHTFGNDVRLSRAMSSHNRGQEYNKEGLTPCQPWTR